MIGVLALRQLHPGLPIVALRGLGNGCLRASHGAGGWAPFVLDDHHRNSRSLDHFVLVFGIFCFFFFLHLSAERVPAVSEELMSAPAC